MGRDDRISCGLCKRYIDGNWDEHVNSAEHQNKLNNLGGANAITQRRIAIAEMVSGNPDMIKIAEKLGDSVDTKMENILTGKKGYNIYGYDDLEKEDGFITPDGNWYSCDPIYHIAFAGDYIKMLKEHFKETNKKLLTSLESEIKKHTTSKDYLIDELGWLSVTVGLTDIYMQPSKNGITYAQKKMLKCWLKKYKHPFHINRVLVNDEFHDFFSND